MEDYPKTLRELHRRFGAEEDCGRYLARLRWPEGFVCPQCAHGEAWPSARGLFICRACRFQTSATAGTILQDTRKPLSQWLEAMWYVTNQKSGVSALGLQAALGLGSYRTAWSWLHKLRHAMVRPGRDRLSGVVELDEIWIGGERPGQTGRGALGKTMVLVAAQQVQPGRIGRIRLRRITDGSSGAINAAVPICIEPGAAIRTDAWTGYSDLPALGYRRIVARKDAVVGQDALPLVNRVASLLKRWLLGTHQGAVRLSHLDYYLDEFTFRFNRRTSRSRGLLFYRLAQQAMTLGPWTQDDIRDSRAE